MYLYLVLISTALRLCCPMPLQLRSLPVAWDRLATSAGSLWSKSQRLTPWLNSQNLPSTAQNRWNILEMQTSSLWDICIHWDGIVAWIITLGGHRGYTKLCLGFCKWDYARGSFLQSRSGKQLRVFIALIKTPITKSTGGGGDSILAYSFIS